jgi:hypothetical protein
MIQILWLSRSKTFNFKKSHFLIYFNAFVAGVPPTPARLLFIFLQRQATKHDCLPSILGIHLYSEKVCCEENNILYWADNQGRTRPFVCTPWVPICLSFNSQKGPHLSGFSQVSLLVIVGGGWVGLPPSSAAEAAVQMFKDDIYIGIFCLFGVRYGKRQHSTHRQRLSD